jgi:ribosomal protein S18 acetylase RimI-like enzyme
MDDASVIEESQSVLRPMTESEYEAWLAEAIQGYAREKVASGQWAEDESLDLSTKEYQNLFSIIDSHSASVGMLWFAIKTQFAARVAYVYDVSVRRERRREGHASRAFIALEEEARRLGLSGIALHVFGRNTGAQALYAKLGFRPTNIYLFKTIEAEGSQPC